LEDFFFLGAFFCLLLFLACLEGLDELLMLEQL
jgi:hypothetical protein